MADTPAEPEPPPIIVVLPDGQYEATVLVAAINEWL